MTRPNPVPTEIDRADAAMTEDDQGSFEKSKAVLKEVSEYHAMARSSSLSPALASVELAPAVTPTRTLSVAGRTLTNDKGKLPAYAELITSMIGQSMTRLPVGSALPDQFNLSFEEFDTTVAECKLPLPFPAFVDDRFPTELMNAIEAMKSEEFIESCRNMPAKSAYVHAMGQMNSKENQLGARVMACGNSWALAQGLADKVKFNKENLGCMDVDREGREKEDAITEDCRDVFGLYQEFTGKYRKCMALAESVAKHANMCVALANYVPAECYADTFGFDEATTRPEALKCLADNLCGPEMLCGFFDKLFRLENVRQGFEEAVKKTCELGGVRYDTLRCVDYTADDCGDADNCGDAEPAFFAAVTPVLDEAIQAGLEVISAPKTSAAGLNSTCGVAEARRAMRAAAEESGCYKPAEAGPAKAGPAKAGPAKAGPAKAGPARARSMSCRPLPARAMSAWDLPADEDSPDEQPKTQPLPDSPDADQDCDAMQEDEAGPADPAYVPVSPSYSPAKPCELAKPSPLTNPSSLACLEKMGPVRSLSCAGPCKMVDLVESSDDEEGGRCCEEEDEECEEEEEEEDEECEEEEEEDDEAYQAKLSKFLKALPEYPCSSSASSFFHAKHTPAHSKTQRWLSGWKACKVEDAVPMFRSASDLERLPQSVTAENMRDLLKANAKVDDYGRMSTPMVEKKVGSDYACHSFPDQYVHEEKSGCYVYESEEIMVVAVPSEMVVVIPKQGRLTNFDRGDGCGCPVPIHVSEEGLRSERYYMTKEERALFNQATYPLYRDYAHDRGVVASFPCVESAFSACSVLYGVQDTIVQTEKDVEEKRYIHGEGRFLLERAEIFRCILNAHHPKNAKQLKTKGHNFDRKTWEGKRYPDAKPLREQVMTYLMASYLCNSTVYSFLDELMSFVCPFFGVQPEEVYFAEAKDGDNVWSTGKSAKETKDAILHFVASGDLDLLVLYLGHDYKTKTTAMQDRQIAKRKTLLPGDNLYGKCMNAAVGMLRRLALGTSEINAMYRAQDIWDKLKAFPILAWHPTSEDLGMLPEMVKVYGNSKRFPAFTFTPASEAITAAAAGTTAAAAGSSAPTTAVAAAVVADLVGKAKKSKASRGASEADAAPAAKRAKSPPSAGSAVVTAADAGTAASTAADAGTAAVTAAEPGTSKAGQADAEADKKKYYHFEHITVAVKPFDQDKFHDQLGRLCKECELPGEVQAVTQATAEGNSGPTGFFTHDYGTVRVHAKFARGKSLDQLKEYAAATEFLVTSKGLDQFLKDVNDLVQDYGVDNYKKVHEEKHGPLDFYTIMSWYTVDQDEKADEGGAADDCGDAVSDDGAA